MLQPLVFRHSSHRVKVKVKLSLCFNRPPRHEGLLGEWRYSSTHSLTSALNGGEWSASRPGRFTSKERAPGTHWIGGWVGPRAVLDAVVKRRISSPRRESNPKTPIVQPVAQSYTDWAITALSSHRVHKIKTYREGPLTEELRWGCLRTGCWVEYLDLRGG
jgi:hypothetical protein